MGFSPSGTTCSYVGLHGGHKFCQETHSSVVPLFTGPQPMILFQHRLLTWSQPSLGASAPFGVGSLAGCRWRSALPWASISWRRTTCLTMVFIMGCRGICSGTWSTSHLSFSADCGVHRAVSLTHSQSSLPGAAAQQVYPDLKRVILRHCHCC